MGTGQEVAIGLAKKVADIAGICIQIDPMMTGKIVGRDLNTQTREVKDGKVQNWRTAG